MLHKPIPTKVKPRTTTTTSNNVFIPIKRCANGIAVGVIQEAGIAVGVIKKSLLTKQHPQLGHTPDGGISPDDQEMRLHNGADIPYHTAGPRLPKQNVRRGLANGVASGASQTGINRSVSSYDSHHVTCV